ncbi:hypothetical protein ACVFI8_17800 [Agarivorans sp. MS3-6]
MMCRFTARLSLIGLPILLSQIVACAPTSQTVYLTPEVKGTVVLFTPGEQPAFSPLDKVTIYHSSAPVNSVLSNEQGSYQLAATSKVQTSFMKGGHSFNYYPVVINKGELSYSALIKASTKMFDLESVRLHSVIVKDELEGKPLLAESGPNALKYCNLDHAKQLRREVAVNQLLKQSYSQANQLDSSVSDYIQDQQQQGLMWVEKLRRSCNWEDESGYPRYRDMKDARDYFAESEAILMSEA